MLKHFKMYVKIDNIIGEKTINLDYPIPGKEAAVFSVFGDNIRYEFTKPWTIELKSRNKWVMAGTYTRKELISFA